MKKLSIPVLSMIAGATAFISVALRIICTFFFYDEIGYYKTGAVLPILANVIFALSLVFFFLAAIFSIDKNLEVKDLSRASQYVALLPMGALIFHAVRLFTTPVNESTINKYALLVFIILAAIFFFSLSFFNRPNIIGFYFGIGALVYVFLSWAVVYFDFWSPINSIDKTFFYIACGGAVLFIFGEMCSCYGSVRSRFYYFSLFASIVTLSTASVSSIVLASFGRFRSYITFETDVFFVTLLIYAVTRMATALKATVVENKEILEEAAEETVEDTVEETVEEVVEETKTDEEK
ncbi:MAG: hypothetical protein J6U68_00645 [Clostridia bacterium]|nr:hypothetical protein [Clostridia bacterium]